MSSEYIIDSKGGLRVPILDADPMSPSNGAMWYNSSENAFKKRENGSTANISAPDVFSTIVLTDDTADEVIISYPVSFRACVVKYYIERDGDVQAGNLLVTTNGTVTSINDIYSNTAALGITFFADISTGNVRVHYSSTSTGFSASLKYSILKW